MTSVRDVIKGEGADDLSAGQGAWSVLETIVDTGEFEECAGVCFMEQMSCASVRWMCHSFAKSPLRCLSDIREDRFSACEVPRCPGRGFGTKGLAADGRGIGSCR